MAPLVETRIEDHVAVCVLNRPEARNALSPELMEDLGGQVERYLRDARVTTLYEGTSQIQKLIIGRDATGINALVPPTSSE